MEKSGKKNFSLKDVFPCGFSISDNNKKEKVSGFFYFRKGEGKCEINYKKKRKKIFPPFGRFFDHFWSLVCRKR